METAFCESEKTGQIEELKGSNIKATQSHFLQKFETGEIVSGRSYLSGHLMEDPMQMEVITEDEGKGEGRDKWIIPYFKTPSAALIVKSAFKSDRF